jgi:hypothetical protein
VSEGYSLPGEPEAQVRTQKEFKRVSGTHELKSGDRGASQDTERIWVSEGHSRTEQRRARDKLGHGMIPREPGALTSWRAQAEGQVRTWKEFERARVTHFLESTDRGRSQDAERFRVSERCSLP